MLDNGLRVWFKRAEGARDVSVSIMVPYGSGVDPVGREQLAHFTEHILFSDRNGVTEEQIKLAMEERGGTRNGLTWVDRTYYFARVERQHGTFAIEWQCGILQPREITAALVERQRGPVLLEMGARPAGTAEWIFARVIDPPALRLPDLWNREFGLAYRRTGDLNRWRSVHAITAADAEWFYRTYYVPSRMTLTVVGDLTPADAWSAVERSCGTLPARPAPPPDPPLLDPNRERRSTLFSFRTGVGYREQYKVYHRSTERDVRLHFTARYLSQRLAYRLRYGPRKAVYSVGAMVERRGRAAMLTVYTPRVQHEEFTFARQVIGEELAKLRDGSMSDEEFAATRDMVVGEWRTRAGSAAMTESFVSLVFYHPDIHDAPPDVVSVGAGLSKAEMAAFSRDLLAPERRVVNISRPMPIPLPAAVLLGLMALAGGFALARRLLVSPLPMARLRYVTRLRRYRLHTAALIALMAATVLMGLRLLAFVFQVAWVELVSSVDSFLVHGLLGGATLIAASLIVAAAGAVVPRKVLVFDDGVAIKMLSYRSRFIPAGSIAGVCCRRAGRRWLAGPAVELALRDGRVVRLRGRDTDELHQVLDRLFGDSSTGAGMGSTDLAGHPEGAGAPAGAAAGSDR